MAIKRTLAFRDAADSDLLSMQLGENGMPEFTDLGVGSNILALSQLVRGGEPESLADEVLANDSSPQDIVDLILLVFVTRNTRGGKGEKELAYKMFLRVWKAFPETSPRLIALFAHYGYWKDYLQLMVLAKEDPTIKGLDEAVLQIMKTQLEKDVASLADYKSRMDTDDSKFKREGPKISLLAKWLPREGYHFDKKLSFVERFAATMWADTAKHDLKSWKSSAKTKYRKTVSELTSYLQLPEVLLSAQQEDEINFQKVASRATHILTKTFLNVDKDGNRRSDAPKRLKMEEMFIEQLLNKGLKGTQLMPHEIVRKILNNSTISRAEELVLDAQWNDLWKNVVAQVKAKAVAEGLDFDPTRMVPLSDVSASMYGVPMEVSIALGIGISEITHDAFKDRVITFESTPRWHRLSPTDSIVKKVRSLARAPWGGSTNFLGAYKLILDVVQKHKLSRDDVPSLIVFSDMQFNTAAGIVSYGYSDMYGYGYDETANTTKMNAVHDEIKAMVEDVGAVLGWTDTSPTPIVFWNLRNTGGHPVNSSTEGAVLLSGFSPSLLKMVMNGEALREEEVEIVQSDGTIKTEKVRVTPEQVLRKMLADSLYDPVREILASSTEGALLEFGTLDKESPSLADEKARNGELDYEVL